MIGRIDFAATVSDHKNPPIAPLHAEHAAMRPIMPMPCVENEDKRTIAPRSLTLDVAPSALRVAFLAARDLMWRFV
jgi:hypothetical protein